MIKVNLNDGELKGATVIAGGVTVMLADLYFLVSLCYGSCAKADEQAGKDFMNGFLSVLTDDEMREKIFSTELADYLAEDGAHINSTTAKDEKEADRLLKGIKELLDL